MSHDVLPILYTFRRCPYAMRARLALAYAQVSVEMREVELGDKPDELIAISPKGTVPVLQLADGTVIEESLDIMRWALRQGDPDDWLGAPRDVTDELILANDTSFKRHLDRYKYHTADAELSKEQHRELAMEFLRYLERCLKRYEGRGLVRPAPSLADFALFPFVRQFAGVDQKWFDAVPLPTLKVWLTLRIHSGGFAQAMKKYPVWKSGAAGVVEHWPTMRALDEAGEPVAKPAGKKSKPYVSKAERGEQ